MTERRSFRVEQRQPGLVGVVKISPSDDSCTSFSPSTLDSSTGPNDVIVARIRDPGPLPASA